MPEKPEDILANVLNFCESDPDAGLEFIEQTMRDQPESEQNPFFRFAKAMAYGSKGAFRLLRGNPDLNFLGCDKNDLRDFYGVTASHLDYLENGLQEIREMEDSHPGALKLFGTEDDRWAETKVDGMAIILERCRPGRVQQILGKTKLIYFGPQRICTPRHWFVTATEIRHFCSIFFTTKKIVRSAMLFTSGKDSRARGYIGVILYEDLEQNEVADHVYLVDDGTFGFGLQPGE